jgi:hypothetical protein
VGDLSEALAGLQDIDERFERIELELREARDTHRAILTRLRALEGNGIG